MADTEAVRLCECEGECLFANYPIAKVMLCPSWTDADIEAAKLTFDAAVAKAQAAKAAK